MTKWSTNHCKSGCQLQAEPSSVLWWVLSPRASEAQLLLDYLIVLDEWQAITSESSLYIFESDFPASKGSQGLPERSKRCSRATPVQICSISDDVFQDSLINEFILSSNYRVWCPIANFIGFAHIFKETLHISKTHIFIFPILAEIFNIFLFKK